MHHHQHFADPRDFAPAPMRDGAHGHAWLHGTADTA